jgi:hypothetical protein
MPGPVGTPVLFFLAGGRPLNKPITEGAPSFRFFLRKGGRPRTLICPSSIPNKVNRREWLNPPGTKLNPCDTSFLQFLFSLQAERLTPQAHSLTGQSTRNCTQIHLNNRLISSFSHHLFQNSMYSYAHLFLSAKPPHPQNRGVGTSLPPGNPAQLSSLAASLAK